MPSKRVVDISKVMIAVTLLQSISYFVEYKQLDYNLVNPFISPEVIDIIGQPILTKAWICLGAAVVAFLLFYFSKAGWSLILSSATILGLWVFDNFIPQ